MTTLLADRPPELATPPFPGQATAFLFGAIVAAEGFTPADVCKGMRPRDRRRWELALAVEAVLASRHWTVARHCPDCCDRDRTVPSACPARCHAPAFAAAAAVRAALPVSGLSGDVLAFLDCHGLAAALPYGDAAALDLVKRGVPFTAVALPSDWVTPSYCEACHPNHPGPCGCWCHRPAAGRAT